jgi:hypothetical protein
MLKSGGHRGLILDLPGECAQVWCYASFRWRSGGTRTPDSPADWRRKKAVIAMVVAGIEPYRRIT